jgi:acetyl esterase/lipase
MDRMRMGMVFGGLLCVGLASCCLSPSSQPPGEPNSAIPTEDPNLPQAATPTLSVPPGTYTHNIDVQIQCPTEGATVHFTTDGSDCTPNSPVYTGETISITNHASGATHPDPNSYYQPFTPVSMTVKAMATREGMRSSEVCTGAYIIDKVEATFDIAYDDPPPAGGKMHMLDIYHPRGLSNTKVVLMPHAGGWMTGDKGESLESGNTLAGYYGMTVVAVNYELSENPWNVVHPAHIKDVAKAFAWTYHNIASYGGDPEKMYLLGASTGAYLVALLGTDASYLEAEGLSLDRIKGVVPIGAVYDLYQLVQPINNPVGVDVLNRQFYKLLIWNAFGNIFPATLDPASPSHHVNASQPPFRLIYSWEDMAGLETETINFYNQVRALNGPYVDMIRLERSDIPAIWLTLPLPGHILSGLSINTITPDSRSTTAVVEFIESH